MLRSRFSNNDRFALFSDRPARPLPGGSGRAVFVGQVVSPASNIGVGKFLMVNPVSVFGTDTEGAPGTVTVTSTQEIPVYLVGPDLAQTGDLLICRFVNYRWVAERAAPPPPGFVIPGCPCTNIPGTLYLHVATPNPAAENYVVPMTLVYGPRPAALSTYNSDAVGYYSATSHTTADGDYTLWYWFGCSAGLYDLRILYDPSSANGYPGLVLVMSYLAGLPGNTCTPFSLSNGTTNILTYRTMGISINGTGPP